jgi:hypothetical protein
LNHRRVQFGGPTIATIGPLGVNPPVLRHDKKEERFSCRCRPLTTIFIAFFAEYHPETARMSGPYDIDPKISQDEDAIWALALKKTPERDRNAFLARPPFVYFGRNLRIAYPGFLTWLKFFDPNRQSGDLGKKVTDYRTARINYELLTGALLRQLREGKGGKKLVSTTIIMNRIDEPTGHLITIMPSRWDKGRDPVTTPDDNVKAIGDVSVGFLRAGSGSTVRISPEALNDKPEAVAVADQLLFHELVHAVMMSDGQSSGISGVDPKWGDEREFWTTQVENVYRSEKGVTKVRGSHDDDSVIWDDTEKLLDHKEIRPPVRVLLEKFKTIESVVYDALARIPQAKAKYNPFREYKEEQDKKAAKDTSTP